ncbi:CBS domain-containing protein [Pseudomonadota bacterium]
MIRKRIPHIKSVMTPFPYSIQIDDSLAQAAKLMKEHDIHHLPVTDGRELVGIVTERDINAHLSPKQNSEQSAVKEVYISNVYIVDLDTPLDNVLMKMAEKHVGSVLVTKKDRLAGLFTQTDACKCFGTYLREQFTTPGGNDAA